LIVTFYDSLLLFTKKLSSSSLDKAVWCELIVVLINIKLMGGANCGSIENNIRFLAKNRIKLSDSLANALMLICT